MKSKFMKINLGYFIMANLVLILIGGFISFYHTNKIIKTIKEEH